MVSFGARRYFARLKCKKLPTFSSRYPLRVQQGLRITCVVSFDSHNCPGYAARQLSADRLQHNLKFQHIKTSIKMSRKKKKTHARNYARKIYLLKIAECHTYLGARLHFTSKFWACTSQCQQTRGHSASRLLCQMTGESKLGDRKEA